MEVNRQAQSEELRLKGKWRRAALDRIKLARNAKEKVGNPSYEKIEKENLVMKHIVAPNLWQQKEVHS